MSSRLARFACLTLAFLGLVGCARNAVFELEVVLPPIDPARSELRFVAVELSPDDLGDDPFSVMNWGFSPVEGVGLGDAPATLPLSVVADDYRGDVLARIVFCESVDCRERAGAEVQLRVESPLFTGAPTRTRLTIPAVPTREATPPAGCEAAHGSSPAWRCEISRCAVAGCVTGELTNYCEADGRHVCEVD